MNFAELHHSVNRALELVNKQQRGSSFVLVDILSQGVIYPDWILLLELNKKDIPFVYLSANYDL